MQRQTTMMKKDEVERKWYLVDATALPLGRMCTQIAQILTGRNKPTYTPHIDCGDYVIVINAEKVSLSGEKLDQKKYYNVSGYAGGLRERTTRVMIEKYPVELIERCVHGMVPKTRLGRAMEKKLFVYAGNEHKQQAQQPEVITLKL